MIQLMKRLLEFSGKQRKNLIASFVFNLLDSVFEMMPIMAILTVLSGLLSVAEGGVMPVSAIWVSLAIMVVSIAGRIFFNNLSCIRRTLGSFSMCSEKRLEIGEHMKHVPMGYFNENRLGEIVAAVTTTLGDIESNAVMVLEKVAGGFIHALVIGVWLLFYEWHIGLLMFAGLAVSMLVYGGIQKAGKRLSPRRQAAQANLVTGFLEYIQGMGVVKAFGLGEMSGKAVNQAIGESADANIILESVFSSLTGVYQTIFKLAKSAILVVAPYLLLGGEITPVKCLLLLVSSFMIYSSVELVGSMASVARVIDASLDRMEAVMDTPVLDEHGGDIPLDHYDIELAHVSFAYGQENVLQDVSAIIPEKTTCAIVGPSGSGKTTFLSLLAGLDVPTSGTIELDGESTAKMNRDSYRLNHVSVIYQNFNLFQHLTVLENAAYPLYVRKMPKKKADELAAEKLLQVGLKEDQFKRFPNMLSGGEQQRVAIARALTSGSELILADEPTGNLDSENSRNIVGILQGLAHEENRCVIIVTHDPAVAEVADVVLKMKDGKLIH